MKLFRVVFSILLVLALVLVTFRTESITYSMLENGQLGWFVSYLIPRLLFLLLSTLLLYVVLPVLDVPVLGKVVIGILLTGSCVGGYLVINLPYIHPWNKTGEDISELQVPEIESVLNQDTPYEGVVCLVLPDCPYCVRSIPNLELLEDRTINLSVSVLVQTNDTLGVERFRSHVGQTSIPTFLTPEPEESALVSRGRYPTFVYVKNGKAVYRWNNGQFGFRALDWVESGLE